MIERQRALTLRESVDVQRPREGVSLCLDVLHGEEDLPVLACLVPVPAARLIVPEWQPRGLELRHDGCEPRHGPAQAREHGIITVEEVEAREEGRAPVEGLVHPPDAGLRVREVRRGQAVLREVLVVPRVEDQWPLVRCEAWYGVAGEETIARGDERLGYVLLDGEEVQGVVLPGAAAFRWGERFDQHRGSASHQQPQQGGRTSRPVTSKGYLAASGFASGYFVRGISAAWAHVVNEASARAAAGMAASMIMGRV